MVVPFCSILDVVVLLLRLDVLRVVDSLRYKSSGRSQTHAGHSFHELEGYLGYGEWRLCLCYCLDWAGQVGGSVEHSEGKGGERYMAILRFLCGSPRPCRLRTALFWP
jgi:hypothetical protein